MELKRGAVEYYHQGGNMLEELKKHMFLEEIS